jgi:hypothetical protein
MPTITSEEENEGEEFHAKIGEGHVIISVQWRVGGAH